MTPPPFIISHCDENGPQHYTLRGRLFLVGSGHDNDLVVSDPTVSAAALKIEPFESTYRCESLIPKHFRLNGKKTRSAILAAGDCIEIGNQKLIVETAPDPSSVRPDRHDQLLEKLKRFVDAIGKERQLQPLLRHLMHILLDLTGGTDIFLFKLDGEGKPQVFESNRQGDPHDRFSDTVVQSVIDKKEGVCIPNALADPAFKDAHSICDLKLQSVLCAPMLIAGKINGLIYIGSHYPTVSFTQGDLSAVNLYAAIAGMLINHIDYMAEQQMTIERLVDTSKNEGLIATSPPMRKVVESVHAVAASDITVLLSGETGTGKSKIAHLVHTLGPRASRPFVVVNCSSLKGELLESEMFGHKKGSFTGAISDHDGLFASAGGGTLLLDEISELNPALQAKLLRTLETKTIRPIGSTREIVVDVRVICASNRTLSDMVHDQTFREDLFYRINQFSITLPPLRDRGEDVLLLAHLFLDHYKMQYPQKKIDGFHPDALRMLRTHTWPGNIRELTNAIHRAVLMSSTPLLHFEQSGQEAALPKDFDDATRLFQKQLLENVIAAAGGNKEAAAHSVGLSRSTFYRYVQQFGL